MKKQDEETAGNKDRDRLLARVLEECLDEDLSFVPPEREIARSHSFSESFEEKMDQLLNDGEEAVRKGKEREIRRHFSPRYGQMVATVLIFLVAGFLVWNVKDLFHSEIASESAKTETAMDTSAYDDAMLEESTAEGIEEAMATAESADAGIQKETADAAPWSLTAEEEEWEKGEINDPSQEGISYCGNMIYPAVQQEVPEVLETLTTLVNCPVQDEDNTMIVLAIGNTGEEAVRYLDGYDLEVRVGSTWYVIPHKQYRQREWKMLEAKMAVNLEIDLTDYDIDYGAQEYRLIAYVDGQQISAEFTFEDVFAQKMEEQEASEASGQ